MSKKQSARQQERDIKLATLAYLDAVDEAERLESVLSELDPNFAVQAAQTKARWAEEWASELERRADVAEHVGEGFDDERLAQWDSESAFKKGR